MRLLRLAIEKQRWDLAAHTIVLATAKFLSDVAQGESTGLGGKLYASKSREKKRRPKR